MSFRATLADLCRCTPANVTASENDSNPHRDTLVRAAHVSREARNGKERLVCRQVCQSGTATGGETSVWPQHQSRTFNRGAKSSGRNEGGKAQDGTPIQNFCTRIYSQFAATLIILQYDLSQIDSIYLYYIYILTHTLSSSQSHKDQMYFPIMTNNLSNSIKYASVNVLLNIKRAR